MKTRGLLLFAAAMLAALCCACSGGDSGLRDGYYTAEAASFNQYGWKEYITIYVSNDKILTVEYDAYNASGFVRSWDNTYMRAMTAGSDSYPNEFTRAYSVALLNWQDPAKVDAVSSATQSHSFFQQLAQAAIDQAKAGDKQVVLVELSK